MIKLNWRKALATVLAAATAFTSVPGTVFAGELTAADDNAIVLEQSANEEADAAVIEPVSEEISVEAATEDTIDVNTTVIDEQEEDIFAQGDTPVAADWHSPDAYTVGKKVSGNVYSYKNNTPEGRSAGLYYDRRFYKFTVSKTGIYEFNATADGTVAFILTPDLEKYHTVTNHEDFEFGRAPNLKKGDVYLLKDMVLYIIADGRAGFDDENDKSYEFTLSLVKEVKIYDKEHPDTISLSSAKTTTGTIERNFAYYNIKFNDNENLSAHENYYQFEVTEAGRLNMEFTADDYVSYVILNAPHWNSLENGVKVEWNPGTNGSEVKNYKGYVDLKKGIYNIKVYSTSSSDGSSNYTLKTVFKPIKAEKNEVLLIDDKLGGSRNDDLSACDITIDKKYVAQSSYDTRTKTDYYKLTLLTSTKLYLSVSSTEIGSLEFVMKNKLGDAGYLSFENFSDYYATPEKPIDNKQLVERYNFHATFPAGTYYILFKKYSTGSYKFELSSGAKVKVKSIAIPKEVTLPLKGEETLTATLKPANADNQNVVWTVTDYPNIVEIIDTEGTTCKIRGKESGIAHIQATCSNADIKPVTCQVQVLDKEVSQKVKTEEETKAIVTNEKTDLSQNDYFGSFGTEFDNTDKFVVEPKNAGTVSKGIFTAKKFSGVVTVTKQVKVGRVYLNSDKVSFEIEQPIVKYQKDAKDKEIKFFTATYAGEVFDATAVVASKTCLPTTWEISDKKGTNFELEMASEKPTGRIICKNNGTCKVTAVYGEGKNASRVSFTLKAVMPKLNAVKKVKQQSGQNFTLNLSNVAADETEIAWSFVPSESKELITIVPDVEFLDVNAAKPSLLKKKVVINNAVSGKIIATVKGHDYVCDLEVVKPEITAKNGKMSVKQSKTGKVAIKNTKLKGYTWVSEDPETVKIVDETKGTIEGVKEGVTRVYTDVAGYRIYCEVTVTAK